ncbi:hypothetical protein RRG08_029603 [Elysia crispata]|uniref:Uncharacterized protein n=1 Tax=Elysia crispata TaxID=231223 RepID=A0AAE0XPW8_9GAST|nr:hypothetical protein RRG08_029603 [Elysia crispata]
MGSSCSTSDSVIAAGHEGNGHIRVSTHDSSRARPAADYLEHHHGPDQQPGPQLPAREQSGQDPAEEAVSPGNLEHSDLPPAEVEVNSKTDVDVPSADQQGATLVQETAKAASLLAEEAEDNLQNVEKSQTDPPGQFEDCQAPVSAVAGLEQSEKASSRREEEDEGVEISDDEGNGLSELISEQNSVENTFKRASMVESPIKRQKPLE